MRKFDEIKNKNPSAKQVEGNKVHVEKFDNKRQRVNITTLRLKTSFCLHNFESNPEINSHISSAVLKKLKLISVNFHKSCTLFNLRSRHSNYNFANTTFKRIKKLCWNNVILSSNLWEVSVTLTSLQTSTPFQCSALTFQKYVFTCSCQLGTETFQLIHVWGYFTPC